MAECEDGQLQFSLLALVRDPLIDARETLAQNIKYLAAIEARLDATMPEWRDFGGSDDADITGPNSLYGVTTEFLQSVTILDSDMAKLKKQGDDLTTLIELRQGVALDQAALRATVASETRATEMDEEKAMDRRNDYGPFIQNWLGLIAENQELRDLVADAKK
jgi:ubiquitin carboxyl-terminal hydrolase L5